MRTTVFLSVALLILWAGCSKECNTQPEPDTITAFRVDFVPGTDEAEARAVIEEAALLDTAEASIAHVLQHYPDVPIWKGDCNPRSKLVWDAPWGHIEVVFH